MPTTREVSLDRQQVVDALASAGQDERLRAALLDSLREAETHTRDAATFREQVRWPLIVAILRDVQCHHVELSNGLVFEVSADSRIEKALLLSPDPNPSHVWEPQTTKLLVRLATGATNVVVGGAYIGDHALPMALATTDSGTVHAFEPMGDAFTRLVRNIRINRLRNVVASPLALWDATDVELVLDGALALASTSEVGPGEVAGDRETARSVTLADYAAARGIRRIELIMLDTEGGEERALRGAQELLGRGPDAAPTVVFEVHRDFVDWTPGLARTPIVSMLHGHGYVVFAVRDIHGNRRMDGQPVEVVPVDSVYLEGPPHGFNMLAIKDDRLVSSLGLQVVNGVSPKLIPEKDPRLHHPVGGFAGP